MSYPNLSSFLNSLKLQQYYDSFLNAGVTDQDLNQFVQFTDSELNEFISSLNMLPFHSIIFKKSIRSLKNNNKSIKQTNITTKDYIIKNAIIYGKNNTRSLTAYEEAINRASLQLALENPLLISKKGELFDLAKKKLLQDGYKYKRGTSRSKLKLQLDLKNQESTQKWYQKRKSMLSIPSLSSPTNDDLDSASCSSYEDIECSNIKPPHSYIPSINHNTFIPYYPKRT